MMLSRSSDNSLSASYTTTTTATNNDNNIIESPPPITTAQLAQNLSYNCSECSEVFSSSQALDCHGTSHHINPILATPITMIPSNATFAASNDEHMEFSPPIASNIFYECNMCEKSFSSYQAPGGHKTKHGKSSTSNSTASNISSLSPSGRPHECSTCHKIYLTGQALGGHKRLHYKGMIGGGKKSNGGAPGQSHCSNIVIDFDLNMPALECPEDMNEVLDDQPLECDEDIDDQPSCDEAIDYQRSCDEDMDEVLDDHPSCEKDIDEVLVDQPSEET
ncbi:unnamed protein product [Fraxinus pennsylvanica]|uniref:C2H2-type domain-containing protein n=1 Tax=Fraxinus pennsylvanica TaxID=56036 RepID=A0AAD1Z7V6_9LAMI|nr:unnamed protein product [Fraxinus pennsylvanica]